jgi:hypothetical protein
MVRPTVGLIGGATGGLAVSVAAVGLAPIASVRALPGLTLALMATAWLGFAAGAYLVLRLPARNAVPLILAGAVALQLAGAIGPPRTSDDLYRYLWDGTVQAAGIDPYRYAPAATELTGLRDAYLWPAHSAWCVPPGAVDAATHDALAPGCSLVNRPAVHTIYPPGAQVVFVVVHSVSPPNAGYWPVRLLAMLAAVATTLILLVGLRRLGRDPRRAVLWAWCPAVAYEAANNAHLDVLAALLVAGSLLIYASAHRRRSAALAGGLLGLAIAVKFTPAAVLPGVVRRWPATLLAAAGVVGLLYLPHVLAVGHLALGYLGGYAGEEGFTSGQRFGVLRLLLPAATPSVVVTLLAAAVVAGAAVVAARLSTPDAPWHAAALSAGVILLVTAPAYPWYALLLVVLIGLGARVEWFAVVLAGYVAQFWRDLHLAPDVAQRLGYGLAVVALVAAWLARGSTEIGRVVVPSVRPDP